MNGDDVRDVTFLLQRHGKPRVYDAADVDVLLHRVAAELDAGRPARPLVEDATFRRRLWGSDAAYPIDAVDWFVDQFLLRPDGSGPTGMRTDPWRDLPVVNQHSRRETPKQFAEECKEAWEAFGYQTGLRLQMELAGKGRRELRTTEKQVLASIHGFWSTKVSIGERRFVSRFVSPGSAELATWPGAAEAAARSYRDCVGHYSGKTARSRNQAERLRALVDETGAPVLYLTGTNYGHVACACISFPDQRWLRFLVRGTVSTNAIMTAVDQAGNKVLRSRITRPRARGYATTLEITVHPDWMLTDEIMLAIAMSDYSLLTHFFDTGH